jgi:hypothetical protein
VTWRQVRAEGAVSLILVGLFTIGWCWWAGLVLCAAGMLILLKWGC